MPPSAVRSVYITVRDMDLMQAFYGEALGLPLAFRDHDKWCQFKAGPISFALSSPAVAAPGAQGGVIVFEATDVAALTERIEHLGGRQISSRDMGQHGNVVTFADPEDNLFQLHIRPGL